MTKLFLPALLLTSLLLNPVFAQDKANNQAERMVFSELRDDTAIHHSIDLKTGKDEPLKIDGQSKMEFIWTASKNGQYLTAPYRDKEGRSGCALYNLATKKRSILVRPMNATKFVSAYVVDDSHAIVVSIAKNSPKVTEIFRVKLDGTGKKRRLAKFEYTYDWDDYPLNMSADGSLMTFRGRRYVNDKRDEAIIVFETKTKKSTILDAKRYSIVVPNPDNKTFAWRLRDSYPAVGQVGKLVDGELKADKTLGENVWVQRWLDKENAIVIRRKENPDTKRDVNFGEIMNMKSGKSQGLARNLRYDDGITHFFDYDPGSGRLVWFEPQKSPKTEYRYFTALFKDGKISDKRKLFTSKKFCLGPKLTITPPKK